jgi:hypothetical protein
MHLAFARRDAFARSPARACLSFSCALKHLRCFFLGVNKCELGVSEEWGWKCGEKAVRIGVSVSVMSTIPLTHADQNPRHKSPPLHCLQSQHPPPRPPPHACLCLMPHSLSRTSLTSNLHPVSPPGEEMDGVAKTEEGMCTWQGMRRRVKSCVAADLVHPR